MERSISQKNGNTAERIFVYKMPKDWILRSQKEEDFGVDYEIELLRNGYNKGFIFKGQLKGTDEIRKLDNNSKVAYSLKADSLKYYLYEIKIPTILFVCDIVEEYIYWVRLTGNKEIEKIYVESVIKNKQQSATIYLSVNNEIKSSERALIFEVEKAQNYLNLEGISKLPDSTYLNMLRNSDINKDKHKSVLKRQMEILEAHEFEEEIKKLNYLEQIEKVDEFLNKNPSSDIYFSLLIKKEWLLTINSTELDKHINKKEIVLEIKRKTKNAAYQLKAYGIINKWLFDIEVVINAYISNEQNKDILPLEEYIINKIYLRKKFFRKFEYITKILNSLMKEDYLVLHSYLFLKMVTVIIGILIYFEEEIKMEIIAFLLKINRVLKENLVSLDVKDDIFKTFVISIYLSNLISPIEYEKTIKNIKSEIEESADSNWKKKALDIVDNTCRQNKFDLTANQKFEKARIIYYEVVGKSLGLNSKSELYDYYKTGIQDINPERILKKCSHIEINFNGRNYIVDNIKMPSAGRKEIKCKIAKRAIQCVQLDNGYESFSEMFCKECNEKKENEEFTLDLETFYIKGCKFPYSLG